MMQVCRMRTMLAQWVDLKISAGENYYGDCLYNREEKL